MADQQFVDEVDGPEDVVDDQQEPTVIIVPAYHQRIEAEEGIDDTGGPVVHDNRLTVKECFPKVSKKSMPI